MSRPARYPGRSRPVQAASSRRKGQTAQAGQQAKGQAAVGGATVSAVSAITAVTAVTAVTAINGAAVSSLGEAWQNVGQTSQG